MFSFTPVDAQADTTKVDTLTSQPVQPAFVIDSFSMRPVRDSGWKTDPSIAILSPRFIYEVLARHPYFGFDEKPFLAPVSIERKTEGKEVLFYVMVALLILFGLLRQVFPKYFSDMFRLVFRTTLKQRQIREQLIQTPLPALMLNIFYVLVAGFYIGLVLDHFKLNPFDNLWILVIYCCLGVTVIYFVKYLSLKFSGWLFNAEDAADSYIFIIFMINKMLGVILLPFILLLAFTTGNLYSVSLTLSWVVAAGLLVYRFILTYAAIRNDIKVNPFHFLLYILALEIIPLLLVYKGLLLFFSISS